ncbi:hypothetical protein CFP56_021470 [Quercus suber]|uniref:Uncharacterized protein n=1 Tax=Quercus suber TaxID=58331 RepID=A0AAW0KD49_QUESU
MRERMRLSDCRTLHYPSYHPILRLHDHQATSEDLLKLIGSHWKWPWSVKTSLPKPRSIRTTTVYSAISLGVVIFGITIYVQTLAI